MLNDNDMLKLLFKMVEMAGRSVMDEAQFDAYKKDLEEIRKVFDEAVTRDFENRSKLLRMINPFKTTTESDDVSQSRNPTQSTI